MHVRLAMKNGRSDNEIFSFSKIDPWFLSKLRNIVEAEDQLLNYENITQLESNFFFKLKQLGFSDRQIAFALNTDELTIRARRTHLKILPVYKTVDTCASEFSSNTPYHYSTYERPAFRIDNDGNIILSNRAMSELIKFNRESGQILWRLGGPMNDFTFINDPLNGPNRQHDARRLENGNLMIFDNGDQRLTPYTRIIEYELDEENLIATLVWEYSHPDGYVSLNQGCAQRLENGNTLICWGGVTGYGQIITEINENNDRVLEIEYPAGWYSYKVRKEDWSFDINLIKGDLNLDQNIDILDVVGNINFILSASEPSPFHLYKIDIDSSGNIDVNDVMLLLHQIT